MARRRNDNSETAKGIVALAVVGSILGWFTSLRDFVMANLPLFIALAVAVAVLLALVVRRLVGDQRTRAAKQRELDGHLASTDGMSGPAFEQLVARLMRRDGFAEVRVPGGSGDLGADVIGRRPDGALVVVQCKRYAERRGVGSPDVQKFLGTCFHEHGADEAWFVTTTGFSKAARDLGTRRGLRLIDRQALAEWMSAPTGASLAPKPTR